MTLFCTSAPGIPNNISGSSSSPTSSNNSITIAASASVSNTPTSPAQPRDPSRPYTAVEAAAFARRGACLVALPPDEVLAVAWLDLLAGPS